LWNDFTDAVRLIPSEAYPEIFRFRNKLGLKPGQTIDLKTMEDNLHLISDGYDLPWKIKDKNKLLEIINNAPAIAPYAIGTGAAGAVGANQLMNQQPESYQRGGSKLNPYGMIRTYPGESGTGVYGDVGLSYDLPTGTSPYLSNQFAFEPGYGSFINPGFGIEQSVGNRGSAYIGANMFDNRPMINAGIKYRFDDGGPLQTDPVLNFITQQQPRRFSKSKK
jgi:hypothetical protein